MKIFRQEQELPITLEEAWTFFSNPRSLVKMTPPEMEFRITSLESETLRPGQVIAFRIRLAPLVWVTWVSEIVTVDEKKEFTDDQRIGPYALWNHSHYFEETEIGVKVTDVVRYHVGWGPIGWLAHHLYVDRTLWKAFDFRRRKLEEFWPS